MSSPDLNDLERKMLSPLKYSINSLEDFYQEPLEEIMCIKEKQMYMDEYTDIILFNIPPIFVKWSEFEQKKEFKYIVHPYIPLFADFKNHQGKSILLLGYRDGIETINFARVCSDITIICESELEFMIIRKTFNNLNLTSKLTNVYTSVNDLPPSSQFDLIYSTGYIGNTCNIRKILCKLQQNHTKPESVLKCIFNSKVSWRHIRTINDGDLNNNIGDITRELKKYGNMYNFSELDKIISNTGFNIVAMWKDHILTYNKEELFKGLLIKDNYWVGVSEDTLNSFKEELGCYTMTISTIKNNGLSLLS